MPGSVDEASPAVAFVYLARWPCEGPLHVDFDLEHSDSVAQYHAMALADANHALTSNGKSWHNNKTSRDNNLYYDVL